MKNTLMTIFLSLTLNNCSSSVIKNVNFDEIKKIKKINETP